MEKAKLELIKTKKGDFAVYIILENGKKIPLSDFKLRDDSLNNKEVEIIRENGRVVSMVCEGKEIYSQKSSHDNRSYKQENKRMVGRNNPEKDKDFDSNKNRNIYSRAPYNFIPLNRTVVPAEKIPEFDRYYTENRFTGYIDIEIEALTPLYIRDALTEEEYKEKLAKEKRDKTYINPDFFSPGGIPRIPGSSLRGMIRTMVEIMSFGKFGFFERERKYHFRSFADKSLDLREQYADQMICGDSVKGYSQKVKAGYLVKEGLDFFIIPAKMLSGTQFFRVEESFAINSKVINKPMKLFDYYSCPNKEHKKKYSSKENCELCGSELIANYKPNPEYKVGFKYIKFRFEPPKVHTHTKPLYYAKVTGIWNIDDNNAPKDAFDGAIILSNWMRGLKGREGKHLHWVIGPEDNQTRLPIPQNVIEDYKNDKNRDDKTDLLKYFKDNPDEKVPCFYIENNSKVISFGHTGLFRLAYSKSLMNFLYEDLLNPKITDISEAIFGTIGEDKENKTVIASRVFFEDAYLINGELMQTAIPKVLSNPKPTTFQHYLEQDTDNIHFDKKENIRGLKTYNDSTLIRGYKLYWHRSGKNWIETDQENIRNHQSQYTRITPIKPDSTFHGKIRFENLSEVELGALLFALQLPEGLAHKLGMGKPLGLGSVKITPKLYLSDREQRYSELLAEWDGLKDETNKITYFKNAFERYVLDKLQDSGKLQKTITSLWDIDRMQQLKIMLDWNNKPKDEKTDYLPLNKFRERRVLPKPVEVVEDKNSPQS
jgi:CRISPR-associated protein (TIGR03986 family)